MKKVLPFLFLLSAFLAQPALAQTRTVTGLVTSTEDNTALPGVNVVVKGSSTGTVTDADGRYSIAAETGNTLIFSYIGFASQEVIVGELPAVNVKLAPDVQSLNEVVVTALGIKQEKRALGYSVQEVKGESIAQTQRENFLNGLQGRVAGLTVTSTSGQPGASASIILRGVNSLSGSNQPLFIIDGIPVDNKTFNTSYLSSDRAGSVGTSFANRTGDYSNRAADLNPEDIESITVLKGPEAAALYGIDAASGAIVITTKKGKEGRGSISYSNSFRVDELYRYPEMQTTYGVGTNGAPNPEVRRFFGPRYGEEVQHVDNLKNFFQWGFMQRHNLSFEGGSDRLTYRLSTSYTDQKGVVPNTRYQRLNIGLAGTAKITDKLTSETSISYINTGNEKASKGAGGFLLGLLMWPSTDDASSYLTPLGTRRRLVTNDLEDLDNPYFDVDKNRSDDRNNRMIANVGLLYDPLPWLNLTARVGMDVSTTEGFIKLHPESNRGYSFGGSLDTYTDNTRNFNLQYFATVKKDFGRLKASAQLGSAIYDTRYHVAAARGERFIDFEFNTINNTDLTTHRSLNTLTQRRLVGVFGQFQFDYNDLLYLTLSGRNDWSSTLPEATNSFFYPSAQLSLVFTELAPLQGIANILSFGKLRASAAQVGKDAPPYSLFPGLENKLTTGGGYGYGFTGPSPNLRPEKTTSYEVGTELQFFNGRLGLDVAYYRAVNVDQIIKELRLSYGTGYVLQVFNGGRLRNWGTEIQLKATPVKGTNFTWDGLVNFTKTNSRLDFLPLGLPEYYVSDTWAYANVRNGVVPGHPLTTITGNTYTRNDKGEILINPTNGLPIKNTAFTPIGDRNPDFTLGITNTLSYKSLSLSFLLDIRKGGDIYNGTELFLWSQGLSTRSLDREQPIVIPGVLRDGLENSETPTRNTIQITPHTNNDYYRFNYVEEDFIEKDINWLRLRDITLDYSFPASLMQRQKLFRSASIFVTGVDLLLLTNYSGADPAVNATTASVGGSGSTGFDYGVISTPLGINAGIRVGL